MPFLGNIGPFELLLVLILALLILGPGKLPEVGQALGRTIREFRKASNEITGAGSEPEATSPATPAQPAEADQISSPASQAPTAGS